MKNFRTSLAAAITFAALTAALAVNAGPTFIKLDEAANAGIEDDGIGDNGQGGWTDEGINDMYIYPPVEFGKVTRNGYAFNVIDPATNNGKSVIILKGGERCKEKPSEVSVKVGGVKAKYLYVLQNAAAQVKGEPKNYLAAVYTVKYADGSAIEIPIRDDIEVRQWWTKNWYDNGEDKSWPFFIGQNTYTEKWKMYLGVWATRWENPTPDKPIDQITFRTEGKEVVIIWAATLDDADYFASPDVKKDFKRPDGPPAGYFEKKLEGENQRIFAAMREKGFAKGVRRVDLIAPDLVAVTIDSAVSRGAGIGESKAAALQDAKNFAIAENGKKETTAPTKVGRHSYMYDTANVGAFPNTKIYWHTYYLRLGTPLASGHSYLVSVKGLPEGMTAEAKLDYDVAKTSTPAIKVNQAAYSTKALRKYAYLGWWAGDLGAVDYAALKTFTVVDDANGKEILSGEITARTPPEDKKVKPEEEVSGEEVRQLDLSPLAKTGRYHIVIPGLGRSDSFSVGGDGVFDEYKTVMRGFLFQRCGCELTKEVCDFPRSACHLRNYESGHLVCGVNEKYENGKPVVQNPPAKPGEPTKEFRGGYHDAGDFDLFYGHFIATSQIMIAFETKPEAFKDGDLKLPESGNSIPDILDEAEWGLKFYADTQQEDGGVISGRGNDEDYITKEWKEEFKKWKQERPEWKAFGDYPPYGNFFPSNASSNSFAAVAAQFSRCVRKYDAKKADAYLAKAKKAYDWALRHQAPGYDQEGISYCKIEWKKSWIWAASELFKTTGEKEYNEVVVKLADKKEDAFKSHWNRANSIPFFKWAYATCEQPGVDAKLKKEFREHIVKSAEGIAASDEKRAYRMGAGKEDGGWGNLVGGGYYGSVSLMAYLLTGDQKHLDAASLNADYQLGANPLSRSFITGLGARPPEHPEVRAWLYDPRGAPCPDIPVFGPGGNPKSLDDVHPDDVPIWRRWLDDRIAAMHSEFGIAGPMGDAAMLYGILWALENGAGPEKAK